jgi:hypothetical protein
MYSEVISPPYICPQINKNYEYFDKQQYQCLYSNDSKKKEIK